MYRSLGRLHQYLNLLFAFPYKPGPAISDLYQGPMILEALRLSGGYQRRLSSFDPRVQMLAAKARCRTQPENLRVSTNNWKFCLEIGRYIMNHYCL